jgi:hypothetical protein
VNTNRAGGLREHPFRKSVRTPLLWGLVYGAAFGLFIGWWAWFATKSVWQGVAWGGGTLLVAALAQGFLAPRLRRWVGHSRLS